MKKNLLVLAFLVGLLTCCKSEDAPIKPVKPTDPGSINKEYMSRAETTFANIFKYYWSDKVRMMFGSYPNTLGTPQEPSSPDYDSHAFLWGLGSVVSAFNAIVQNTDNVDFRMTYESRLKETLLIRLFCQPSRSTSIRRRYLGGYRFSGSLQQNQR